MPFPAIHSVLSPDALAPALAEAYGLPRPTLKLIRRGLNDTYRVDSSEQTHILRVYRHGWRTPAEVDWELDFVRHLAGQGVKVSRPIARLDNRVFDVLDAVEGQRPYALFEYLPGRALKNTPAEAALYGAYTAGLHNAADSFTRPDRFSLDIDHLITEPLRLMRPVMAEFPELAQQIEVVAERSQARLNELAPYLSWGACHGDLHEINARLTTENTVAVFDFDCAGPGFRAYDLAVYWWSQVTHNQQKEEAGPLWDAFLGAYLHSRTLTEADHAALPHFVLARALWFMGLMAGRTPEMGTEALGRGFFEYGVNFMRQWTTAGGPGDLAGDSAGSRISVASQTVIDLRPAPLRQQQPMQATRVIPLTLEAIEEGAHGLTPELGPLLVVCEHGNRSALAARFLRADGLEAQSAVQPAQALAVAGADIPG